MAKNKLFYSPDKLTKETIHVYEMTRFLRIMVHKVDKFCDICGGKIPNRETYVRRYREYITLRPVKFTNTDFCLACWLKYENLNSESVSDEEIEEVDKDFEDDEDIKNTPFDCLI